MLMDAKAAIDAIGSSKFHARTKHIDVKWRILNQLADAKSGNCHLKVVHVPTTEMLADILTKPVVYAVWCYIIAFVIRKS